MGEEKKVDGDGGVVDRLRRRWPELDAKLKEKEGDLSGRPVPAFVADGVERVAVFVADGVERVAECIAAVRELGTCPHHPEKVTQIGTDGEGVLWCEHCGALLDTGAEAADRGWSRSEIGQWAEKGQR
jgi:hypothetical protein